MRFFLHIHMFIAIYGVQGCGKGTQAKLIAEKLGIQHISTGDVLRTLAQQDTDQGRAIKAKLDAGIYLSDAEMTPILKQVLPKNGILDGYPRTLGQAKTLDSVTHVDVFLSVTLSDAVAIERMQGRGRSDDTPAAIQHRLDQFHAAERQILDYYRTQGKLVQVNGEQSVEQVFNNICAALRI